MHVLRPPRHGTRISHLVPEQAMARLIDQLGGEIEQRHLYAGSERIILKELEYVLADDPVEMRFARCGRSVECQVLADSLHA